MTEREDGKIANGAAVAAFLAAGIGSFALGLIVILNETGLFAPPALYGPAGGVTGRATLAVAIWLASWASLHRRWKAREIDSRGADVAALVLIALGIVLTLPPVWRLF